MERLKTDAVYETGNGQELWYLGYTGWMLGPDHNTDSGGFLTPVNSELSMSK